MTLPTQLKSEAVPETQSAPHKASQDFARALSRRKGWSDVHREVTRELGRRYRQARDLISSDGPRAIAKRALAATARRLSGHDATIPVARGDVVAADLTRPKEYPRLFVDPAKPIIVNWVTTPPRRGSGGHTTLFRIVRYLEAHGYSNRIYFYDVYGGDHEYYAANVREYYGFRGPIGRINEGMADAHAIIASSWPTAYPVFNSPAAGKRFYFIQDFEPYFYPAGSISALAESTYRMGFHGITIGRCFAEKLRADFGMTVDTFEYGCDTSQYWRSEGSERRGIVFYARRGTARRGFEIGLMALESFAALRPDIEIHIYGDRLGKLPFAYTNHGHLSPEQLNELYNRCYAGLSLSFTNVSLVAQEMLAAGCIPVVNESMDIRTDLHSPYVHYAHPNPSCFASKLQAVVEASDFDALSRAAAASVRTSNWADAGAEFDSVLRRELSRK